MSTVRHLFGPEAKSLGAQALEQMAAAMEEHAKTIRRVRVGYPTFERMTHLHSGQFVILGGRPGAFKTTWALNMATNLSLTGKRVLWVDLDRQQGRLANALLSRFTGIPKNRLTDHFSGERPLTLGDLGKLKNAKEKLYSLPLFFLSSESSNIDAFFEDVRMLPYDAMFVDYLQLLQVPWAKQQWEGIALASNVLSWLAKLPHRPLVVAVSQLTRGAEQRDTGPQMSDLAGSNRLEYEADVIATLIRDDQRPGVIECHILKNRDGPVGTIPMEAFGERGEVTETVPPSGSTPGPGTGTWPTPGGPVPSGWGPAGSPGAGDDE